MGKIAVPIKDKPYLTPTQAAALVDKGRSTIYAAIESGELKFYPQARGYRIKRADLDEWMERGAPK